MTTTRGQGSLYTSISNAIATIEFGHPSSNAFPLALLLRLARTLEELSGNDQVQVIVLKSEGERAFCAGASLEELVAIDNLVAGTAFFSGFAKVINAMRSCSKVIIGRIQGKAVGGGVGLVAACDYCLATEAAAIRLSELSIGLGPLVIEPAVTRKIGVAAMSHLALDPTHWQSAYWAKEHGAYAKVFETVKELDHEVELLAGTLARYHPEALQVMKKVLWANTAHWETLLSERAVMSAELVLSAYTKKALQKFKK